MTPRHRGARPLLADHMTKPTWHRGTHDALINHGACSLLAERMTMRPGAYELLAEHMTPPDRRVIHRALSGTRESYPQET